MWKPGEGHSAGMPWSHAASGENSDSLPHSFIHSFIHTLILCLLGVLCGLNFVFVLGVKDEQVWDAWLAQLVKHLTSAQVMISRSVSSSPTLVSQLSAQSLLQIFCLPLSLLLTTLCVCVCLSQK